MKPIKLVLSAFGSYGGCECVDFEKMQQGLFLITGDTGAGKTTIFDGISYALYGQTSGRRRDGEMMRSQYAKDTDETYVEFTFNEGGKIYTVRRNPNWMRRSKRKNKDGEYALTKVSAKVELIMPDGTMFPGKMKETDQKIIEIIGMDMNQFSQVSMISQGDFMKLLLASSKERKEIFSKIFPTQIYWRIQMQLKERENQLYGQLENIRNRCRNEIENVQCLNDSSYIDEWKETGVFSDIDNGDILELLEKIILESENKEKEIRTFVGKVEKALDAHRVMSEQEKNREIFVTDIHKLEPEIQLLISEVNTEQNVLTTIRKNYEEEWHVKQNQILKIRQELPEYDRLDQERKEWDQVVKQRKVCQKFIYESEIEVNKLRERLNQIQIRQEKLKDSGVHKVQVEQLLIQYQEKSKRVETLLNKQLPWNQLQKQQREAKKRLENRMSEYQLASQKYDRLYTQFIASQAGLMARDLQEGKPCPVCGSTHHPAPHSIQTSGAIVDQVMVENAKSIRDRAEAQIENERQAYLKISNENIALKNQILQEASTWIENVEKLLENGQFWELLTGNLRESQRTCHQLAGKLRQLNMDMETFESNQKILQSMENQQKEIQEKYVVYVQKSAVLETEEKQHGTIVAALGEKLIYGSKKEAEGVAVKLEQELGYLKRQLEKREEILEQKKNRLQVRQGQLTERKNQLAMVEKEASKAKKAFTTQLDKNNWEPDLSQKQLELMKKNLMNEEKKVYSICESNKNIYRHLKEVLANYKEEQLYFAQIRNLSRIANGGLSGAAKIDFQTYMQRRYFKQMVHAANRRLAAMSRNQFLLECRDMDQLGKQGEVGLDLDVYSLVNDNVRDIKTLSGGESFMAALALALGMADVIQQEAGKIHVDTLFIDEGFGSLDENSRNQAVSILNDLAGGERLVGIISHVHELKEQIEQKIQVEKTEHGSKIVACYSN